MANFIDSATVPVAAPEKNKFDMGYQHITTSDFMDLDCAYVKEVMPGEKVDVSMETFARLNAMPVPGFGRCVIKKHKFFVPMRQIYAAFTDMMSDVLHTPSNFNEESTNIPSEIPTITNKALVNLFIDDAWTGDTASTINYQDRHMVYSIPPGLDFPAVDIVCVSNYTGSTSDVTNYNFTETGRQVYKLLTSLGYGIVWENCKDSTKKYNATYSLLPLLGYIKIWCDWFFPMQYSNASIYQQILRLCKKDDGVPYQVDDNASVNLLRNILKNVVYTQYDSTLISNAWDTPNQPSWQNYSDDFRIKNIDTIGQIYGTSNYNIFDQNGVTNNKSDAVNTEGSLGRYGQLNAPFITLYANAGTGASPTSVATAGISEYLLKSLKALSAYMKRNQLIGSRAYERMMARYGQPTPGEKINRAVFLGSETQGVQIGDVTSSSDTEQGKLGDFAGKGVSYGTTHLQYDSDEFGYIYILTSIVPISQTYQGVDPLVMRGVDGRTSYYVPEYDSLGVEALPSSCVYLPQVYNGNWQNYNEQVWGFVPRYATLKANLHDKLSGNFRCASLNGTSSAYPNLTNGASSWHLMREFDDLDYQAGSAVTHSIDYMFGYTDNWQYKRIFYGGPVSEISEGMPAINPDNFTIIHNFEVASYAPMKKLYDVIDELEVDAEHTHKNLKMQIGGVKVN